MYIHALNNMAGAHKLYRDYSNEEEFDEFAPSEQRWEVVSEDERQGNGLVLCAGSAIKLDCHGSGIGAWMRGSVIVGRSADNSAVRVDIPGKDHTWRWNYPEEGLDLPPHIHCHAGAWIDAFGIIHGPLTYRDWEIPAGGGVHISGTAYLSDNPYEEICVETAAPEKKLMEVE
jgi:hypothetical protein